MFVITIIVVFGDVDIISLFYLYLSKIRNKKKKKNAEKPLQSINENAISLHINQYMKMLYLYI